MCPSYRATLDEQHLTRGRANSLRLAISGQLGPDAFTSQEMKETLDLCVSCKGCRRECPTGVDMAKMKIEFLHHYHARHGLPLKERLVAFLPRYAPLAAKLGGVLNLRDRLPGAAGASQSAPELQRPPLDAALADAVARARAGGDPRRGARRRPRHRPLRRHLQPLFRAGQPRRRRARPRAGGLPAASRSRAKAGRSAAGAPSCRPASSRKRERRRGARLIP